MDPLHSQLERYGHRERAILVSLILPSRGSRCPEAELEELRHLARTAGAHVVAQVVQQREAPDPAYFIGRGKAMEVAELCRKLQADLVIFQQEPSPVQVRNLSRVIPVKILDRSQLILDVFARHAQSREGKLQVELAQLVYLLPRLTGPGVELSRLGGGIGTRGPGETKLEMDRRRIRARIRHLEKQIERVRTVRHIQRRARRTARLPLVSLVGYTNAGKSTLLNALTAASVKVEDKLFTTLDPTTRRLVLPDNTEVLITDTVGFISELPEQLMVAFRATLEHVAESDLLIHVVDTASPERARQMSTVQQLLAQLGAENVPVITVFNKIDLLNYQVPQQLLARFEPAIAISALRRRWLDQLLEQMVSSLSSRRRQLEVHIPYSRPEIASLIHRKGRVLAQEFDADGVLIRAELDRVWADRVEAQLRG